MGDCKKCPFCKTKPVPENLVGIVNLTEWSYCDVDAVGPAAADRIANQSTHIAALHESEGWGYDRIMRLESAWHKIRDQYAPAINPSDPEADVYQEHMDRVLAEIINGKQELYPFASRYPELKKIKYGR